MKFINFASGSKGNATLFIDKDVLILIDAGLSRKQLDIHFKRYGYSLDDLDFILLTHDHSDHIKGLDKLIEFKIYGGENTYSSPKYKVLKPFKNFKYKHLTIIPVEVSHDANDPLGYIFKNKEEKLTYITDTGLIKQRTIDLAKNSDYIILESNHDKKMLIQTDRPQLIKNRIMSEFGHLCNNDCAMYLSLIIGDKTKQVYLAHLSSEANTPELAKETCLKLLKKYHIKTDKILVKPLHQGLDTIGGSDV